MRPPLATMIAMLALATNFPALAASQHHSSHHSSYSGQQHRVIKSLSAEDVTELRRGGGWGLAKAAELNGLPGPVHLLEMKEEISLTPKQLADIKALFKKMQGQAIAKGERLIALEKQLDDGFKSRRITTDSLNALLSDIAQTRSELRFIHLSTHLQTPKILTADQIKLYNRLRGYH